MILRTSQTRIGYKMTKTLWIVWYWKRSARIRTRSDFRLNNRRCYKLPRVMKTDAEMREWSRKLCCDNSIHVHCSTQTWGVTKSMPFFCRQLLGTQQEYYSTTSELKTCKKPHNHHIEEIMHLDNYGYNDHCYAHKCEQHQARAHIRHVYYMLLDCERRLCVRKAAGKETHTKTSTHRHTRVRGRELDYWSSIIQEY